MWEKINNFLKGQIVTSIIYIALGACLAFMPVNTINVICKFVFGILLILVGFYHILIYILEKLNYYDNYVKSGEYARGTCFSHFGQNFFELDGKTWGIIGLGAIGNRVAQIAKAFGCHIICYSASGKKYNTEYEQVSLDELLSRSDILSVHAPLNGYTENLMTLEKFRKMKKSAIFLNLARGAIVNEPDLYTALTEGSIAGAGLDVLCKEPMDPENPLLKIQDSNKLIITPHIAWAAKETRFRVVDEVVKNIQRFQRDDRNRLECVVDML